MRRIHAAAFVSLDPALHAQMRRLLGDLLARTGATAILVSHAAEDAVQETFLRMFGFLSGLRENTPLRPWLKRVAANLAIDRLRRQQRPGTDMALAALADPASASPADAADADTLLRRLPPLARTVVWLHEMEGWSHEDLGRRFGRTASWSKSLMSRSLARLRQDLDPHGDAPHDA